jgi:Fungal specific transcription factor domain
MIPAEQHALHYFLANFVLLPAKEGGRGFFDFLIPLLKNEPPDSHLSVSFNAVALAALGNRPNSKMLLVQASAEYSRALSYTNKALANPIIQKSDQTLAAVLLLGLFEVRIES